MIKGVLFGLSLVLNTAVEPYQPQLAPEAERLQMSAQQKNAVIQPLLRIGHRLRCKRRCP